MRNASLLVPLAVVVGLLLSASVGSAADDPPFKSKTVLAIPFSGTIFNGAALGMTGEFVDVTGTLNVKLELSYRGGPVLIKTKSKIGKDLTAVGQTSGDHYRYMGSSKQKLRWKNTITGLDEVVAMEGDPIPGLDVKIGMNPKGALLQYHVDFDTAGQVTGSLATVQTLPMPGTTTAILQIEN